MSNSDPILSIIIVSFNTRELLTPCLDALNDACRSIHPAPVVVVVDNASVDGSVEHLERYHPSVRLIPMKSNVGFGRANNLAFSQIQSKYVLLLNTDAFVPSDALNSTIAFMQSTPDCGVLGVRLVGRDGVLQPSCRYFPTPLNNFVARTGLGFLFPGIKLVDDMSWSHDSVRECDWVPGCFYLLRTTMIDQVGLFDPGFFLYYEEVDHCWAAKAANWKVIYFPDVSVIHIGGESAKSLGEINRVGRQVEVLQIESAQIYIRKRFGLRGVLAHVFLEELAGAVLIFKSLLRREGWAVVLYHLRHMRHTLATASITRFGLKATR